MPAQDAAEAAEFAAVMAEITAEEGAEPTEDEEAEPVEAEDEAEPEQDAEEAEPEAEEKDEDEEEEQDLEAELTADEQEAAKLFLTGDIKAACKRLGVDPKIFKVKPREFTAMRKGLREADTKLRTAATYERQGKQLHDAAEQTYGPIVAGFQGHQGGRPLDVKAAIELMCEDSFENVINGIVRAAKGLSPAEAELLKLKQERVKEKDAATQKQAQEAAAAQETKEVTALSGRLKGTPLERVDGAAAEIRQLVINSFDGTGYGKTVKEAYAEVKAKYAKIAESVTGKPLAPRKGAPVPAKGKKRSELAPLRAAAATLTASDRAKAQKAADDEEFRLSVREASAAGNRMGVRRGR